MFRLKNLKGKREETIAGQNNSCCLMEIICISSEIGNPKF